MTLPSTLIPPLLVLVFIGDSVICALAGVSTGTVKPAVLLKRVPRAYRENCGSIRVLPGTGYGVRRYGYGVGKPDPRVTRSKP